MYFDDDIVIGKSESYHNDNVQHMANTVKITFFYFRESRIRVVKKGRVIC